MLPATPRYVLQADALFPQADCGEWRFVLTDQSTGKLVAASDSEPGLDHDRLALLALVRGLEAIPRPGRVTLLTSSRTLRDGLRSGLANWKANDWKWERFGRLVTIRDHDLWQRIDQALQIHSVQCRSWRLCVADHAGFQATHPPDFQPASLRGESATRVSDARFQPSAASRSTSAGPATFLREPALLVIRKAEKRNRLRIDHHNDAASGFAQASAG